MKRQIRRNVFETNSSSMHSISIIGSDRENLDLPADEDGKLVMQYGEYAWDYERLSTPRQKIQYLLTAFGQDDEGSVQKDIIEVVKEYTGVDLIVEDLDDKYYPKGYIDHQSLGVAGEHIGSKKALKDFIFNDKYAITIDNDNT